jgi:hypothetical protein
MSSTLTQPIPVETHSLVRKRFSVRTMSEVVGVLINLREQKFTGAVSIHISEGTPAQYSTEERKRTKD